jgi:hypothetical protein
MNITQEDVDRWRKLAREATPIKHLEGERVGSEPPIYDAIFVDDDGFEYSCATFDHQADALLFASAASIINRLLDALKLEVA